MMSTFVSGLRCAVLALALTAVVPIASAQDAPAPAKKARKATGSLSEPTYRQLERIYKLMAENKNDEALGKLNTLLEKVNSPYEKCLVLQTIGYVYANQNNYKKAIQVFEQALALDSLPQQPYEQLLFNIAQMSMAVDQYDKAVTMLTRYFAEATNPPPDAYILLASIYAEKKRFRDALTNVDKGIALASKIKEPWLQLKLALHYELKEYSKCAETLLSLISIAPAKKDYWKQYSSILFEIKDDKASLAVLALADRQGFLTEEREFRNLANVYMLMEIPYKAARVLTRGFEEKKLPEDEKALTTLADAWFLSREYDKSAVALKKTADMTGKGDLYFRLAQIYIEDEKWKQALATLDQAQKKGVTKVAQAAFLSGIAHYQLGDMSSARRQLIKAADNDDIRKQAQQWIALIDQTAPIVIEDPTAQEAPAGEAPASEVPAEAAPAETPAATDQAPPPPSS